jgi:hypothetical protein
MPEKFGCYPLSTPNHSGEDNFSRTPLLPDIGEASFTRKTPAVLESLVKQRFSQLARLLLSSL